MKPLNEYGLVLRNSLTHESFFQLGFYLINEKAFNRLLSLQSRFVDEYQCRQAIESALHDKRQIVKAAQEVTGNA